jgi:peptide/nickel transport system ATP-binding protein
MSTVIHVENLSKHFRAKKGGLLSGGGVLRAVNDVNLSIERGEVVGLVGESGSGKSTLGRAMLRLIEPTDGRIVFKDQDITHLSQAELRRLRRHMQFIFQDPYSSLDPRKRVEHLVGESFVIHGMYDKRQRRDRVVALLEQVGLSGDHLNRFPHEFSGGQRQRLGIARAFAVEPSFIVADEPVSALDVSVQAQIINLLAELQERMHLAMMFISHDLSVVEHISDRVLVMYLGHIMESAPTKVLYSSPAHPYTEALLSAAPVPEPGRRRDRIILKGDLPSPINPPSGCVFRTRCMYATEECAQAKPSLVEVAPGHFNACIREDVVKKH